MGAVPEGSDAGSLVNKTAPKSQSLPVRAGGPTMDFSSSFRWRTERAGGRVWGQDRAGRGQESEMATLIRCLSGGRQMTAGGPSSRASM
jgi:hypothetical protein